MTPKHWIQATVHCEDSEAWWRKHHDMGMFLILRVGPIYHIRGIMDQFEYIKIPKEVMLPYAEEVMPLKWVFQQDNNPNRVSAGFLSSNLRLFKTFFKTCTNKFNTIWAGWGNVYSIILNCKITVKSIIYSSDTSSHKNKKFYKL